MGEVLSQSEIDNLLKQLNSGELDVEEMKNTEEKTVKNYDFARPAKFSKEHLRTLEIIFAKAAALAKTKKDCFRPIFLLTCVCRYRLRLRLPKP